MYSERLTDALAWAHVLHQRQIRKGSGIPYVTHLLAVASLVGENGGTEDQVIGALLHDSIEDCSDAVPDIREQIAARFGAEVLRIVEGCTDADTIPKPPWRERKELYVQLLRAKEPSHPSVLVSLSDKVHNARSILRDYREIGDELWSRFRGGREGTLWYYHELAEAFGDKGMGTLADELRETVSALERLAAA